MRFLDYSILKYVARSISFKIYQCEGVRVHMYVCMYVCVFVGGVEVEIPIVMWGDGEESVKIAPSGISCKYSV